VGRLAKLFKNGEFHEGRVAYFVDAFIDSNPVVKEWSGFGCLLLLEKGISVVFNQILSADVEKYETEIIELLSAAAVQVATGEHPDGRVGPTKKFVALLSSKEESFRAGANPEQQMERGKLSRNIAPIMPKLLNRFVADEARLKNLLAIIPCFQCEIYQVEGTAKVLFCFFP